MKPLPLPVRIAAGLVATAVDQARDLPRLVVEFPVTAVSQALQATMRVQQKVTELAIKGDRALGTLRPVEEKPSWATFDDEEPVHRNGTNTVTELRPQKGRTPVAQPPARPAPGPVTAPPADPRTAARKAAAREAAAPAVDTTADTTAADTTAAQPKAAQPKAPRAKPATRTKPGTRRSAVPRSPERGTAPDPAVEAEAAAIPDEVIWTSESGTDGSAPITTATVTGSSAAGTPPKPGPDLFPAAEAASAEEAPVLGSEPTVLPGYANMTIPQLRGRLRFLSVSDLRTLLEWENAHGDRPAFVTMLSNRITAVQEG